MKSSIILFLISILILVLFFSTFMSAKHQEGFELSVEELTQIYYILKNADKTANINAIKSMGIKDDDIISTLESDASDEVKCNNIQNYIEHWSNKPYSVSTSNAVTPSIPAPTIVALTTPAPTASIATTAALTTPTPTVNYSSMSIICYYNFNTKNTSNTVLNTATGLYDLSLNGTTNLSISSTYTKFGFPSLYRSVPDSAFGVNYYYKDVSGLGNSFTVAFWIRTLGLSYSQTVIRIFTGSAFILFYLSGGNTSQHLIQFGVAGDNGDYKAYLKSTGFSNNQIWNANDWNHVAFTASYDGTNTDVNMYFNGSLVNYEFVTSGGGLNTSTSKITAPANAIAPIKVKETIFGTGSPRLAIGGDPYGFGLSCHLSNVYLINKAINIQNLTSLMNNNTLITG